MPELQRRGLFRTTYEGKTLRENLGLKRPENQYVLEKTIIPPKPPKYQRAITTQGASNRAFFMMTDLNTYHGLI